MTCILLLPRICLHGLTVAHILLQILALHSGSTGSERGLKLCSLLVLPFHCVPSWLEVIDYKLGRSAYGNPWLTNSKYSITHCPRLTFM